MTDAELQSAVERLKNEHGALLVFYRVRNNRADYSIANTPEPTLTGISDAVLLAAIVHAGRNFKFKRVPSLADRDPVVRTDGKTVRYRDSIEIDWDTETIEGSGTQELTLQVLGIVVENLSKAVVAGMAPPDPYQEN
jgi:hypothetical protein